MNISDVTEQPEPPTAVRWSALLAARASAIESVIKQCGGEQPPTGGEADPIRAMCVMLAREAAGMGFDEGIKYASAANSGKGQTQDSSLC